MIKVRVLLMLRRKHKVEYKVIDKNFKLDCEFDLIILAGFIWKIPEWMVEEYLIINIHPSLLPKHGGRGMYGDKVHESVFKIRR